jgi:hypothetical protein
MRGVAFSVLLFVKNSLARESTVYYHATICTVTYSLESIILLQYPEQPTKQQQKDVKTLVSSSTPAARK